jgi:hypothetical protein
MYKRLNGLHLDRIWYKVMNKGLQVPVSVESE